MLRVAKVEMRITEKNTDKKPRVYFSAVDKQESIVEQFGNRVNRPYEVYRKLMPEVLKELGLPDGTKFRWSQKAGCSCGCSPGFILDARFSEKAGWLGGHSIWVSISGAPLVDEENDEGQEEAERRKMALEADPTIPDGAKGRGITVKPVYRSKLRCIDVDENHFKEWEVEVVEKGGTWVEKRRWGRIGQAKQSKEFEHGNSFDATEAARKMVARKRKKGYREVA